MLDKRDFLVFEKEAAPSADPFRDALIEGPEGYRQQTGVDEGTLILCRGLGKQDYQQGTVGRTKFETEEEQNAYYEGIALAEEEDMARNDPNPAPYYDGGDDFVHSSWTGRLGLDKRQTNDFADKLRDISRG